MSTGQQFLKKLNKRIQETRNPIITLSVSSSALPSKTRNPIITRLLLRSKTLLGSRPTIAASSYFHRFFVISPSQDVPSPPPASDFAVQYLIKSCGLPSDQAARASRHVSHLKSPHKPDAVLRFLRQVGVSESQIKAAVLRDPRLLCRSVEKCWQPRMAQLQEIGFSPSHISLLLSICPSVFSITTLKQNVLFWSGIFSSTEELLHVVKNGICLLTTNLKTISANLSFLKEQCRFSARQILQLIKLSPRLITSTPHALKDKANRAEQLGIRCSSPMFLHALKVVNSLNQSIVDARINNLTSLGFSHEEVTIIVRKNPYVLARPEDIVARKMEFLTKEAGCDKMHLVTNPYLLNYSTEKRLIPRNLVRKFLKMKGFHVADQKVYSFMKPTEKQFVDKFVLPYEPAIPGFLQAYEDACAGNIERLEWFKSNSL